MERHHGALPWSVMSFYSSNGPGMSQRGFSCDQRDPRVDVASAWLPSPSCILLRFGQFDANVTVEYW